MTKKNDGRVAALGLFLGLGLGLIIFSVPFKTAPEEFVFDASHEGYLAEFLDKVFEPQSAIPAEWRNPPVLGVLRETRDPPGYKGSPQKH